MHDPILTVVVSQGQSRNPEKRALEDGIASTLARIPQIRVLVVPHLYDLPAQGETMQRLRSVEGPMVVLGWLYERAIRWVLDRNQIRGSEGEVLLIAEEDEDEETDEDGKDEDESRVIHQFPRPDRLIYCIDLRASLQIEPFIEEVARIYQIARKSRSEPSIDGATAMERFSQPTNSTALSIDHLGKLELTVESLMTAPVAEPVVTIEEHPDGGGIQSSTLVAVPTVWSASTFACLGFMGSMELRRFW